VQINRFQTTALLDSGAGCSCLSLRFALKINAKIKQTEHTEKLTAADGRKLEVCGCVEVTVNLNGLQVPHTFFVISGLNSNVIFGCDFMKVTSCRLDLKNSTASFFDDLVLLALQQRAEKSAVLRTVERCVLPARSECLLPVTLPRHFTERLSGVGTAATAIVEPFIAPNRRVKFLVARTLHNCKKTGSANFLPCFKF